MKEKEVLKLIRDKIKNFKLLKQAAYDCGVTPSYMTQVRKGHRPPYGKVLAWVGVKKTTVTTITYEAIQ